MGNTKHTPGPWIKRQMTDGFRITRDVDGTYITSIISREGWSKDTEANAKLIAAAPELLGVLIELCDNVKSLDGIRDLPIMKIILSRSDVVIKKVTA